MRLGRITSGALSVTTVITTLLAVACGEPSDARPTPRPTFIDTQDVNAALADSRERFGRLESFRLRYEVQPDGIDGRFMGEGAFRSNVAIYGSTTFAGSDPGDGTAKSTMFLPPDLYLQEWDADWLVISPWNQGIRPDEQVDPSPLEPIIDYTQLVDDLYDVTREPDGNGLQHYRATLDVRDLQGSGSDRGSAGEVASVDLWLQKQDALPSRLEVHAGDFSASFEFADYDELLTAPPPPAGARPFRDVQFPNAPCTGSELAGCLVAQTGITASDACAGPGKRICLVPLGQISPELVAHLAQHYRDHYGLTISVLEPSAIPPDMADPLREQVDADRLIEYIASLFPAAYDDPQVTLIGLTVVDLFDAKSHFRYVFGVRGTPDDPESVVSTFRMDPLTYGETPDDQLLYARTRKLVSKYIGLMYYALPTSSDPLSPMFDSILGPDDLDRMQEPLPVGGAQGVPIR